MFLEKILNEKQKQQLSTLSNKTDFQSALEITSFHTDYDIWLLK